MKNPSWWLKIAKKKMTFLSNYELTLLLSCNEIRYSSDYFQKKMGGTQLLGQNSHT